MRARQDMTLAVAADVKACMVLNHTSGLSNWAPGPPKFDASPGTEWHYSGEGYLLMLPLGCSNKAITSGVLSGKHGAFSFRGYVDGGHGHGVVQAPNPPVH